MQAVNTGDTAWMLVSSALVMFMTPGLALFYGGMVRTKNVLGTIMQSFFATGLMTLLWVVAGYSLAFSPGNPIIGGLGWVGLRGVGLGPNADYAATIPHLLHMIYQGMFAIITPALITGAFAERMKFKSFLVFTSLWLILVYAPIAHWVWGVGGWLRQMGVLDFAGGLVVHTSSGVAALAAALLIGKRKGFGTEPLPPHNVPMTVTGAAILWFGWFGFNAGSALTSGQLATSAFVATHLAAAAGAVAWVVAEWIKSGKPTTLGAASGAVAGLATITPASGYVTPMVALLIGLVAGVACYLAVTLKWRLGYDDSLDVVGVHGVGGILGALAIGLFATKLVNPGAADGLAYGNPALLGTQALGVATVVVFSFTVSAILLKLIDMVMGLRPTEEEEDQGLDLSQHAEVAYETA